MFSINVAVVLVSFIAFQNWHYTEACSMSRNVSGLEAEIIDSVHSLGRKISYAQWGKDQNANVVLSPLSITTILNLLMAGTGSTSNTEIKQFLNYSNNLQEIKIHEIYRNIFTSLQQSVNGVEIGLFTRLFLQKGFSALPSYKNIAKTSYFSEVENVDFRTSAIAMKSINNWVSNSTKGKIEQLFSKPLETDTVCVVTNVIFFNATWENQFSSRVTRNGTFYAEKENITIPMMNNIMRVPFVRDQENGFNMIALPYKGNRYSMYIVKPINENINELQRIENTLDVNLLNTSICRMSTTRMSVTLPRMKLSSDLNLKSDLKSFGVNKIFSELEADFGRFTNQSKVFVSFIVHKAILEVTEAGTTAAAVTAVGVSLTSLPRSFRVDRPFLLFIRDNQNGVTLFRARVMKPKPLLV